MSVRVSLGYRKKHTRKTLLYRPWKQQMNTKTHLIRTEPKRLKTPNFHIILTSSGALRRKIPLSLSKVPRNISEKRNEPSWDDWRRISADLSFMLVRAELLCLRGNRTRRASKILLLYASKFLCTLCVLFLWTYVCINMCYLASLWDK